MKDSLLYATNNSEVLERIAYASSPIMIFRHFAAIDLSISQIIQVKVQMFCD